MPVCTKISSLHTSAVYRLQYAEIKSFRVRWIPNNHDSVHPKATAEEMEIERLHLCTSNANDILTGLNNVLHLDVGVAYLTVYGYSNTVNNLKLEISEERCKSAISVLSILGKQRFTIWYTDFRVMCDNYIFIISNDVCLSYQDLRAQKV